jgi:acyl-CoA synthetase (NDP forming)
MRDVPLAAAGSPSDRRDLAPLFDPRSVAVVGASSDQSKWGGDLTARLLRAPAGRDIYLVNRKGGTIHGQRAFTSLREVGAPTDLVFLAVPAAGFEAAVDDALAVGAKALVVVTAGLGELGAQDRARQDAAVARVRAAGALLVGPNCPGVADTTTGLNAVALLDIPAGPIAFVSQSGGVGDEIVMRTREFRQGFTRFVTLGNQADVGIADVLWSLVDSSATRLVAIYAEDLRDGRRLAAAAGACIAAGKPVLLLAPGRSEASSRAARSHTGALTSDASVVDAVCRAVGALRVETPDELVETAVGLLCGRRPRGKAIAITSDGGGHSAIAADVAASVGLSVPRFSSDLRARLSELLPINAALDNPVDFAIASIDPSAHARVGRALLQSGEVDALLVTGEFGYWGARFPELSEPGEQELQAARDLAALAEDHDFPVIVSAVTKGHSPAVDVLLSLGVPVYREILSAARVLARLAQAEAFSPSGLPELPQASAEPLTEDDYWSARRVLAAHGVPFVPAHLVHDTGEALAAAHDLGYPVALKAMGLLHKSDAGGVALDLADERQLRAACVDLQNRLAPCALSVERMAPRADGIELIVGCRQDPRFGPVLLVGLGGIYTEILKDSVVALAPVDEYEAERLLTSLRGAPLLCGARRRPALDVLAAARVASVLSRFAAAHPEVAEVELNPLLLTRTEAVALDARVVLVD